MKFIHLSILALLLLSICYVTRLDALGTMAIDLGNEFIKVAVVKAGIPMEIALNKESQRKTAAIVSIRGKERFFGSPAESISVKYPAQAYQFIPSLIGKTLDHPSVKLFQKRFPFYELDYNEKESQIVFKQNGVEVFTVEELMAMILENARDVAEAFAEEPNGMKNTVITVPHHFGQAERRAILRAASLVNLEVNQLINEDSAVALHFGVFRSKSINATAQHFMFFNIGSQSSSATIARYETVKDSGSTTPSVSIIGVGADPTLGISEFVVKLRDHLAKAFQKEHKLDIFKDHRAMMKLLKEAKRVVTVLSANMETYAQVEYLMAEKDFKHKVTRSDLEDLCADLFERIKPIFDQALEGAQIALSEIKEIILMGGGTRVPKVQETLLAVSGKTELGRSINSDEAAALGAVYQAAFHSPGFRVKKFILNDFNYYPIKVSYKTPAENDETSFVEKEVALYNRGNRVPQKRALSVNKCSNDMDIYVNYGGLDEHYIKYLLPKGAKSPANLTLVRLVNVTEAIDERLKEGARMKGFKVHFDMDRNSILSVVNVDARLETIPSPAANKTTLESIGDTISGLFSGSDSSKDKDKSDEEKEKPLAENATETGNATASDNSTTVPPPPPVSTQPQIISVPISITVDYLDAATPSEESMEASRKKLREMREHEHQLIALEKSRNELEAYIFNTRDRLHTPNFVEFSPDSDRSSIEKALDLASEWYEEQGADVPREEYERQLESIRKLVHPVDRRMKEHNERPTEFDNLLKSLEIAQGFSEKIDELIKEPLVNKMFKNLTADFGVFPFDRYMDEMNKMVAEHIGKVFSEEQLKSLNELIEDHRKWHNETTQLLEKHPKHEDATVTVKDIVDKQGNVAREVLSIRDKFDNNRRSIRLEVQKWVRSKRNQLREEAAALEKNKTDNANKTTAAETGPAEEKQPQKEEAEKEEEEEEVKEKEEESEPSTTTTTTTTTAEPAKDEEKKKSKKKKEGKKKEENSKTTTPRSDL